MKKFIDRKDRKQLDPVLMSMQQASISKTLALTSDAIKNGTIEVIRVPESVKRKLKQAA